MAGQATRSSVRLGSPPNNSPTRWLWLGLAVLLIALLAAAIFLPPILYPTLTSHQLDQLHLAGSARASAQNDRFTLQNNARTALIQIVAGAAVLSGAVVGWRQLRHNMLYAQEQQASQRETLLLDHFVKGIQHLGDDNADVRLGGVYSLGLLAEESVVHRQAVGDVLSSFVRNHSPWPPDPKYPRPETDATGSELAELRIYAPDVQAAMTILGKHTAPWYDVDGLRFRYCDLRRVNLSGGHFERARFTEAHLVRAWMISTQLAGASLRDADLTGADLSDANLSGANLRGTVFTGTMLAGVNFQDAAFDDSTIWPEGFSLTSLPLQKKAVSDPPTSGTVKELPAI